MRDLTPAEKELMKRTAEVWNGFLALDPLPTATEKQEFMLKMHDLQRCILSRPAIEELKK